MTLTLTHFIRKYFIKQSYVVAWVNLESSWIFFLKFSFHCISPKHKLLATMTFITGKHIYLCYTISGFIQTVFWSTRWLNVSIISDFLFLLRDVLMMSRGFRPFLGQALHVIWSTGFLIAIHFIFPYIICWVLDSKKIK